MYWDILTFITLYLQGMFCHFSGNFWKTHQVSPPRSCVFRCTSRNSNGRRVTTPPPRGRKSRPTMDSINELLPRLKRVPPQLETLPGTLKLTASRYATLKIGFLSPKEKFILQILMFRGEMLVSERLKLLDAFSLFDLPQTWVIWWPLHNYMWPWGPFPATRHPKLTTTIRN